MLRTEIINNQQKIANYLTSEQFKKQLQIAMPKHMNADRIARIALTELRKTPKLGECDPYSFMGALMKSSQLGLEVGGDLGHAYFVPFDNKQKNITECQLIIGYRGMLDLARRSGQIISLQAHIIYEGDEFEFSYGIAPNLHHVPARKNRGGIVGAYACAILKDGGNQFEVMWKEDIDKVMQASRGAKFSSSPWQTHYEEMARKTVIRRLFKLLPISIEMCRAITIDEATEAGYQDNMIVLEDDFMQLEHPEEPISKADQLAEQLKVND